MDPNTIFDEAPQAPLDRVLGSMSFLIAFMQNHHPNPGDCSPTRSSVWDMLGMNLNPDRHFDLDQFDGFDGSLLLATASPRWTLAIGKGFVSILFSTFSGGNDFRSRSGVHQYFLGTTVAIDCLRSLGHPSLRHLLLGVCYLMEFDTRSVYYQRMTAL